MISAQKGGQVTMESDGSASTQRLHAYEAYLLVLYIIVLQYVLRGLSPAGCMSVNSESVHIILLAVVRVGVSLAYPLLDQHND